MNKRGMEQMRMLKQELDTLRFRYMKVPREEFVGDTYGDYRTGHKHIKTVQGYSTVKSDRLLEKINQKQMELEQKVAELEDYIEEVEEAEMRDIIRLYYVEGYSQEQIGELKGYDRSTIAKKLNRFWEGR